MLIPLARWASIFAGCAGEKAASALAEDPAHGGRAFDAPE
jgi:hypothetical protein